MTAPTITAPTAAPETTPETTPDVGTQARAAGTGTQRGPDTTMIDGARGVEVPTPSKDDASASTVDSRMDTPAEATAEPTVDHTTDGVDGAADGAGDGETSGADREPSLSLTAAAVNELRELTRARWAGWLAPLGKRAGDLRPGLPIPTSGLLKARQMPLPFFWQRETTHGGQIINGAVEIGALTYADIRSRPDDGDKPWIWGTGYIDLNESDGVRYVRRLADRMSRWISVKLDFDPEFEPPAPLVELRKGETSRTVSPTDDPDWWRLMNVTAESQPAFDGAEIHLLDDIDDVEDPDDRDRDDDHDSGDDTDDDTDDDEVPADTGDGRPERDVEQPTRTPGLQLISSGAEVNAMSTSTTMQLPPTGAEIQPPGTSGPASGGSGLDVSGGNAGDHGSGDALLAVVTGDTSLPLADRDTKWDGPEAAKRLVEWAGGRFKLDVSKMSKVFLYRDSTGSPKFVGAWKFPIADVIGGQVKIVPRAVFTAAAVLRGSMGGTKIPKADQGAMRGKINTLYKRMAKEFKDDKIRSPFEAVVSDAHVSQMRTGDKAPGAQPPWRRSKERKRERRGLPRLTASASSWAASVAERVPEEPPREWFTNPGLTRPSKIRVTDDGRVFGHVAAWHTEHAAFPGVHPPRNRDKSYSKFHRHPVRCANGEVIKTGPLATGGHTTTDVSLAIESVQAHYDDPRYVVADVVCGEDEHGIWVSGSLRPGVSPFQVMLADRYSFSGDWRYGELLAACSVTVPGFHLDADEEVGALTAAAASAGCYDLPVVAEAEPALIADASGAPAVLIAAGVVIDDTDDINADFTGAIDALGTWLQQELAALRAEFGMTTSTTTEQVITQLQNLVLEQLSAFRTELGLPEVTTESATGAVAGQDSAAAAAADATPEQPAAATTEAPAQPAEQPAAPAQQAAQGAETQPAPGSDAPQTAPASPAQATAETSAPTTGPTAPAPQTATTAAAAQVEQFQQWLAQQFVSLRADRAAATSTTTTAAPTGAAAAPVVTPVGATADFAAGGRQALLDEILDERARLLAAVHAEVA